MFQRRFSGFSGNRMDHTELKKISSDHTELKFFQQSITVSKDFALGFEIMI